MSRRNSRVLVAVATAVLVVACGGGGSTPPSDGTSPDPGSTGSTPTTTLSTTQPIGPSSGGSVVGWFEVDGQRVDATDPFRCPAISFSGGSEDDFRVGVFGVLDSEELIFEVQETNDGKTLTFGFMVDITTRQYVSGATLASGGWESRDDGTPWPDMTYSNDGSRLKGGPVTIVQEWPQGETGEVVVSFDIPLPTELWDGC